MARLLAGHAALPRKDDRGSRSRMCSQGSDRHAGYGEARYCCASIGARKVIAADLLLPANKSARTNFYLRSCWTSCQSVRTTASAGSACAIAADCPAHACMRSMSFSLMAASRIACVSPRCTG
jgi:hypothetical protein